MIPVGRLFTCRLQISPEAPPGEYRMESDHAVAASADNTELEVDHFGGIVRVVAPSGGGGGPSCALEPNGRSSLALLVTSAALLWARQRSSKRRASKLRGAILGASFVALGSLPAPAWSQLGAAEGPNRVLEVGGSIRAVGSEGVGSFQGEVTVFPNEGISGSVPLRVGDRTQSLNISARLERGSLRFGRLRGLSAELQGAFAEKIASTSSARPGPVQSGGSLRLRDGTGYHGTLEHLRLRSKPVSEEMIEVLARGEATKVVVHLDTYPAEREIRVRYRDKTGPSWVRWSDKEAASKLERQLLEEKYQALSSELVGKGL